MKVSCLCRFRNTPYLKWSLLKCPCSGLSKLANILYFFIILANNSASSKNKNIKCLPTLTGHYTGILKAIILSRGCFGNGMDRRLSWNNFFLHFDVFSYPKKGGKLGHFAIFWKKWAKIGLKMALFCHFCYFFYPNIKI